MITDTSMAVQVGSILNFSLMYFLAPTTAGVAGGAAAGSFMQRLFSDVYLRSWGAPTGHLFEAGFPLSKRLINFGYKVPHRYAVSSISSWKQILLLWDGNALVDACCSRVKNWVLRASSVCRA